MGDFLRGVKVKELPEPIARGVHNHLAVDRYTDSHSRLKPLKALFSAQRRRFAGIIIDVVFDHFLIKYWQDYSRENLATFTAYCYESFKASRSAMPPAMQQKVAWMIQYDLLNSYADLSGVGNALNGISRRMRFENQLAGAIEEVAGHYQALEQGFREFFTALCEHIRELNIEAGPVADRNTNHSEKHHATHNLVHCNQFRRIYRPG